MILKYVSIKIAKINSQENDLVFCNYVRSVIECIGQQYIPTNWPLFTDVSKVGLKSVLVHNRIKFPSVSLAHASSMKESYENMEPLLEKIQHKKHLEYVWEFKVHCCLLWFAVWLHKASVISLCVGSRVRKTITSKNSGLNETRLNTLLNNPQKLIYLLCSSKSDSYECRHG